MTISGEYAHPVTVNGFTCKNCTDVDNAKRHIDPAPPRDGPFGVNASEQSDNRRDRSTAFRLGGNLAGLDLVAASQNAGVTAANLVDLRV